MYELCQMDERRVNVAALWSFPIIHIEAKEGQVERHFSKMCTPNTENWKRVFCYCSVKKTLQEFLKLPGFSEKCEQYKKRPQDPNFLGDIYDGRVWKNFKSAEGKLFFDAPNTPTEYRESMKLKADIGTDLFLL